MVDVIKSLPVEYIFASPGSSFRSLHESVVNYGGNKPEFITCTHEEIGVAMGNGYAKIEGKPALSMAHGTVGCQHAAMAVYNAYCDQVPNILILGNISDAAERRGSVEWLHSVQDAAAMIREFTKWDDNPASLQHFGESTVRAYQLAMTPPTMPVVLVADGELAGESDSGRRQPEDSEIRGARASGGRSGHGERSSEDAGGGGESRHRHVPFGAHAGRA